MNYLKEGVTYLLWTFSLSEKATIQRSIYKTDIAFFKLDFFKDITS